MDKIKRLPDGELEIMQAIWRSKPPISRAEIEKELGEERGLAVTTILTFLTRLCEKGFLTVEKQGRTNCYTPLVSERDYLAQESRNIFERLYGGSIKTFATALSDSGLSKEDLDELYQMLEKGEL